MIEEDGGDHITDDYEGDNLSYVGQGLVSCDYNLDYSRCDGGVRCHDYCLFLSFGSLVYRPEFQNQLVFPLPVPMFYRTVFTSD